MSVLGRLGARRIAAVSGQFPYGSRAFEDRGREGVARFARAAPYSGGSSRAARDERRSSHGASETRASRAGAGADDRLPESIAGDEARRGSSGGWSARRAALGREPTDQSRFFGAVDASGRGGPRGDDERRISLAVGVSNELASSGVHVVGVRLDGIESGFGGGGDGLPLSRRERIGSRGRARHEGAAQGREGRLRCGYRAGLAGRSIGPREARNEGDQRGREERDEREEHEQRPQRSGTELLEGLLGDGAALLPPGSGRRGARLPPDARGAPRHDIPFSTRSVRQPSRGRKDWSDAKCDSGAGFRRMDAMGNARGRAFFRVCTIHAIRVRYTCVRCACIGGARMSLAPRRWSGSAALGEVTTGAREPEGGARLSTRVAVPGRRGRALRRLDGIVDVRRFGGRLSP